MASHRVCRDRGPDIRDRKRLCERPSRANRFVSSPAHQRQRSPSVCVCRHLFRRDSIHGRVPRVAPKLKSSAVFAKQRFSTHMSRAAPIWKKVVAKCGRQPMTLNGLDAGRFPDHRSGSHSRGADSPSISEAAPRSNPFTLWFGHLPRTALSCRYRGGQMKQEAHLPKAHPQNL